LAGVRLASHSISKLLSACRRLLRRERMKHRIPVTDPISERMASTAKNGNRSLTCFGDPTSWFPGLPPNQVVCEMAWCPVEKSALGVDVTESCASVGVALLSGEGTWLAPAMVFWLELKRASLV
jgi:hypothetical protein